MFSNIKVQNPKLVRSEIRTDNPFITQTMNAKCAYIYMIIFSYYINSHPISSNTNNYRLLVN